MKINLPMPGEEGAYEDDYEEYDEGEWDTSEWEDELPEPASEDEQVNGAFPPPRREDQAGQPPRHRRRMPPMPRVPRPKKADPDAWEPPFTVQEDGTVTGVTLGEPSDELPPGFDAASVPKGSFEGVLGIFRAPGSGGKNLPG